MNRYRQIEVWSRQDEGRVIIYRCLQDLSSKKYMVDRAEIVPAPVSRETLLEIVADQLEIFIEESPENRLGQFDTLDQAIEAHDSDFGNNFLSS